MLTYAIVAKLYNFAKKAGSRQQTFVYMHMLYICSICYVRYICVRMYTHLLEGGGGGSDARGAQELANMCLRTLQVVDAEGRLLLKRGHLAFDGAVEHFSVPFALRRRVCER